MREHYRDILKQILELQQPYIEDKSEMLGNFLSHMKNVERKRVIFASNRENEMRNKEIKGAKDGNLTRPRRRRCKSKAPANATVV